MAAGNFHLRFDSPAIDAGADLGYQRDWDGASVPAGLAPDLGAYEFAASTPTAAPEQPVLHLVVLPMFVKMVR